MKAQMRKELLEILLVAIIIVAVYYFVNPLFASTRQGTSESFRSLADDLQKFIDEKETISELIPYYIDQGYFFMVCKPSTLCICGKDQCKEKEPFSRQKFEGYDIKIIGNKDSTITGDAGLLDWNRGVANIVFKKESPNSNALIIIDCATKENRNAYVQECEPQESS